MKSASLNLACCVQQNCFLQCSNMKIAETTLPVATKLQTNEKSAIFVLEEVNQLHYTLTNQFKHVFSAKVSKLSLKLSCKNHEFYKTFTIFLVSATSLHILSNVRALLSLYLN